MTVLKVSKPNLESNEIIFFFFSLFNNNFFFEIDAGIGHI